MKMKLLTKLLYKRIGESVLLSWEVPSEFWKWYKTLFSKRPLWKRVLILASLFVMGMLLPFFLEAVAFLVFENTDVDIYLSIISGFLFMLMFPAGDYFGKFIKKYVFITTKGIRVNDYEPFATSGIEEFNIQKVKFDGTLIRVLIMTHEINGRILLGVSDGVSDQEIFDCFSKFSKLNDKLSYDGKQNQ
ncbi:hypothetical protein [uncultured Methylophaga sp.]|uniref:hypothetical protein n=2 Tax=Methylophaga TaxID=40222 RepID=UPI00259CF747|nr:hypothetical protein [uncultured Methylophaga sp.]